MFENLYTTKMSSSKRVLQQRFTKIRSKSGRLAKIMSLVVTLVLAFALGTATVVMAATDSGGLEHWDKAEVYRISCMQMRVNVNGKTVPDWVKKITGQGEYIDIDLGSYAYRNISGEVSKSIIGKFTGKGESLTLCNYQSTFDPGKEYMMFFSGSYEGLRNDFNIQPEDGRFIRVTFDIDENERMVNPKVEFLTIAEGMGLDSKRTDSVFIPENVSVTGGFDREYYNTVNYISTSGIFMPYENGYKNKKAEGINLRIVSAGEKRINLAADINRNDIADIRAAVYNSSGRRVSQLNGIEMDANGYKAKIYNNNVGAVVSADRKNITLYPPEKIKGNSLYDGDYEQERLSGQFISGNIYRVELGLYDKNGNLVYRYMDYVAVS